MTSTVTSYPVHPAAELFPLLADDELADLAEDIRTHGLVEPVWLYDDPELGTVLLDGRNRARACEIADVPLRLRKYSGDDPITFSISQNMKRRHLTVGQKAAVGYAALPLYEEEARRRKAVAAAEENRRRATEAAARRELEDRERTVAENGKAADAKPREANPEWADLPTPGASKSSSGPQITSTSTTNPAAPPARRRERAPQPEPDRARNRAASVAGTSGRAVAQFKRIAEQAPDLSDKVRSGSLALDRAERIIRDREAEQRRIVQARREAEQSEVKTTVDIRHGDFRDTLADLTGVDAIITDPPYPHEFIPLLGDLATWADKVLGPDGVLAVLIGQTYLPEVYRLLDSGRPYRWTGCYLTSGPGYVSHPRRVSSNWKPLIVYGGGPRFADVIRSEGTDAHAKSLHKWGQDYNAFHTIIERLTERGQTVVDPFMGAGTTLLAAHALGRNTVGCDVDEVHVATARERLA